MAQGLQHDEWAYQFPSRTSKVIFSPKECKQIPGLTMSMYDPLLAIAKYSPSNEKLNAFMAFLVMGEI